MMDEWTKGMITGAIIGVIGTLAGMAVGSFI